MKQNPKNLNSYTGHGKSGGIQLHSQSELFSIFGLIMVFTNNHWQAERNGKIISVSYSYEKAEAKAKAKARAISTGTN